MKITISKEQTIYYYLANGQGVMKMSYLNKTTLQDFDEAYRYGATLTLEELEKFDKLLDKVEKEFGSDSIVFTHLLKVREHFL